MSTLPLISNPLPMLRKCIFILIRKVKPVYPAARTWFLPPPPSRRLFAPIKTSLLPLAQGSPRSSPMKCLGFGVCRRHPDVHDLSPSVVIPLDSLCLFYSLPRGLMPPFVAPDISPEKVWPNLQFFHLVDFSVWGDPSFKSS